MISLTQSLRVARLRVDRDDSGFGLVEIVVSLLLLALLSIMFLPLLIQGLQISAWNTTLATANQLVNQQIAAAQAESPDCADVLAVYDDPGEQVIVVADPRGVQIQVTTTLSTACPTTVSDDLFLPISVEARRLDEPGRVLVSADSLIFVEVP